MRSAGHVPIGERDIVLGRTVVHVVESPLLPGHDQFLAVKLSEALTDSCQG